MRGKYESPKKQKAKKPLYLPAWIFIPAMVLYNELLLHFWTADTLVPGRLLTVTLFALAFGSALGALVSLLRPKAQKWVAIAVAVLVSVISLMEYFLHDAYQNFMPFVTIFAGAGGVMTDYLEMIVSLLVRNLWRIGLVLLPIVLYAVICTCKQQKWLFRGLLAVTAVVLYLVSFLAVNVIGLDRDQLSSNYEFDSAVQAFGLNMAMIQDLFYSTGAVEQEMEFEIMDPGTMPTMQPVTLPTEETTAQEATEAPTEAPVVYGYNVLDLDFAALAAETKNSTIASIHSYVASQAPSQQNAYTGLFEGKNLIFITAEAFTSQAVDPELTPTLYRLANEGIKFTDYYQPAWGASTTSGEYSNVVGLVPANGGSCMSEAHQQNLFLTIGNQLKNLGYTSTAYHNHLYTFYSRNQTHTGLGYDKFIGMGNGMTGVQNIFPESDLEMMQFSVEQYIDQQPFNIYYMSVSGHSVYSLAGHAQARKNIDKVAHMEASEAVKCYYAAQLEFEYAMEYLVRQLEEAGIADDTVIVISTDHYPYGLDKSSTYGNSKNYLTELYGVKKVDFLTRDSNTLIIWSGCLEDKDIVVDTPVYSLDILPTLSNLFGVKYDSRLLIGRDVFSDTDPLVLWPNGSWRTDLGTYNVSTQTFTPAEGVADVSDDYIKYISSLVTNKTKFSKSVASANYYNEVVKLLNTAEN